MPLPDRTVAGLRTHRTAQREARLLMGPEWVGSALGSLVFTTGTGARGSTTYDTGPPRSRWRRACRARVVADMLGHSNVSMTLSVYSHVLPELRRDAADRMDAILDG